MPEGAQTLCTVYVTQFASLRFGHSY